MSRKHQLGPLRRALTKYEAFLAERPTIVAGDFNNNVFWHRPGWRINHANAVAALEKLGLASAYQVLRGELHGDETVPTLYWRDRKKEGPTYHIDYIFLPEPWLGRVRELAIGTFEDWCGSVSAIMCRLRSTSPARVGEVGMELTVFTPLPCFQGRAKAEDFHLLYGAPRRPSTLDLEDH